MRTRFTLLLALLALVLAVTPAWARRGEVKLDGTVVSADQGSMLVQSGAGQTVVLIQRSTEFKGSRSVRVGDRVKINGFRMDDGRVFATRIDVKKRNNGNNPGNSPAQYPGNVQATVFPRSGENITVTRPPIGATFSYPVTLRSFAVDGRSVAGSASWDGRRVSWTPSYDLDFGNHSVSLQATDQGGRAVNLNWSFRIVGSGGYQPGYPNYPGSGSVSVTNLQNGQSVPQNFNVQGQAAPQSRIVVTGRVDRALIPGVITLPGGTIRAEGSTNQYGRYDVPVQAGNVPNGSRVNLTVTSSGAYGQAGGETTLWVTVNR